MWRRQLKKTILILFAWVLAASSVQAQNQDDDGYWDRSLALKAAMTEAPEAALSVQETVAPQSLSRIGILFSAALPGAGQVYARSWVKGAVFLAAEIALWMGNHQWNSEGEDLEDDFHAFVDDEMNWSYQKWHNAYNSEVDPSTHHLPMDEDGNIVKTQQYYEMIGKYDQFKKGWADWQEGSPDLTPLRDEYETLRDDSNRAFKKASYCTMAILGNHIISALDAALTIKNVNARAQMSMIMTPGLREPVLLSGVAINW